MAFAKGFARITGNGAMANPGRLSTTRFAALTYWIAGHDVTDFEDELAEVRDRVFEGDPQITVPLAADEANAIRAMAKGVAILTICFGVLPDTR
jgi:HAMP domain-containing protein